MKVHKLINYSLRLTRSWYLRYGSSTYQFLLFQKEVVILSNSLLWVLLQNTCSLRRFRLAGFFFHSFFLYPAYLYPKTRSYIVLFMSFVQIQEFWKLTVKQLYLASDPKATVKPHKPICDRFYRLPLSFFHTVVRQTSGWLLSHSRKKCRHPVRKIKGQRKRISVITSDVIRSN